MPVEEVSTLAAEIRHMNEAVQRIERKVDQNLVTKDSFEGYKQLTDRAIAEVVAVQTEFAKNRTWIVQLVLGAVILAGLGLLLVKN